MNHRTIGLIARYEAKVITREWSFRVVAVLSVLIVAFLHVITQSSIKEPEWIAISLPSAIPFANVYLVNILQIIIAIFWAGNFLREDKSMNSNSSVSARPFSNMELLIGKTLGFIIVINAGIAKINSSGQGADPNQTIVADAVKWVKIK